MPRVDEYKRVRAGLVFADVGKIHRDLLAKLVEEDHSDTTKTLRWLIEQEWNRRHNRLVDVIGEGVGEPVPVFGVSA